MWLQQMQVEAAAKHWRGVTRGDGPVLVVAVVVVAPHCLQQVAPMQQAALAAPVLQLVEVVQPAEPKESEAAAHLPVPVALVAPAGVAVQHPAPGALAASLEAAAQQSAQAAAQHPELAGLAASPEAAV